MTHKTAKILIPLLVLLIGCLFYIGSRKHFFVSDGGSKVQFYYWRTHYNIDETLREKVKQLECNRVYLHFFDVIWKNGMSMPVAKLAPVKSNPLFADSVKMVPVVFITNEVFANTKQETGISELAKNVNYLISRIANYNELLGKCEDEIQIDCDWTQSTRSAYFAFLDSLAKFTEKKISCTIRLHQVKDVDKMGVPPAVKGCLMCYATSDPTETSNTNSILDIGLLKNYTKNVNSYPLPLTYALPLYSWGIVTNNSQKIRLINGLSHKELSNNDNFTKTGENTYKAVNDCFINGFYVNKNYTIEIEEITPSLLMQARQYINDKVGDPTIVYYHLSKGYLERFPINDLK
ncbi:MAG: hypothetical protein KBT32_00655 [Bacteroidales bacterium]|nr:hypothetical protein [Candidatus Physcocola equi]